MKRIFAISVMLILLFSALAFAEQDAVASDADEETEETDEVEDTEEVETEETDEVDDTEEVEEVDEEDEDDEDDLTENEINEEMDDVESDLEIETEVDYETGKGHAKAKLKDGTEVEVKVMPSTASEKALEALSLHNCVAEEGCTIELKEEDGKLTYEFHNAKEAKLFGFIKTKMDVEAQVDAETGEVIKTNKPWWHF